MLADTQFVVYAHSMAVDPLGKVIADAGLDEGIIQVELGASCCRNMGGVLIPRSRHGHQCPGSDPLDPSEAIRPVPRHLYRCSQTDGLTRLESIFRYYIVICQLLPFQICLQPKVQTGENENELTGRGVGRSTDG